MISDNIQSFVGEIVSVGLAGTPLEINPVAGQRSIRIKANTVTTTLVLGGSTVTLANGYVVSSSEVLELECNGPIYLAEDPLKNTKVVILRKVSG